MDQKEIPVDRYSVAPDFTDFVTANEASLRRALIAAVGGEAGREAARDALAYGWEHWARVKEMDNPIGYLYRVGVRRARRAGRRRWVLFDDGAPREMPDIEPGLIPALGSLSERQRTVVVMVHCFQMSLAEVGEVLGIGKTSVQNHLARGIARLRKKMGVENG